MKPQENESVVKEWMEESLCLPSISRAKSCQITCLEDRCQNESAYAYIITLSSITLSSGSTSPDAADRNSLVTMNIQ